MSVISKRAATPHLQGGLRYLPRIPERVQQRLRYYSRSAEIVFSTSVLRDSGVGSSGKCGCITWNSYPAREDLAGLRMALTSSGGRDGGAITIGFAPLGTRNQDLGSTAASGTEKPTVRSSNQR